jgi:hypothetical protein
MSQGDRRGRFVAEGELPIDNGQQAPASDAAVYVKDQVELADILGVDRKSIQRWKKIEGCPGAKADGRYDVTAWKTWMQTTRRGHGKKEGKTKHDIETQIAELKREELEIGLKKTRGELASVDEVCEVLGALLAPLVNGMRTLRHDLAPQVVGESVPEATKRLGAAHHALLEKLSVGEWAKKKAFWSNVSARFSGHLQKHLLSTGQ